MLAGVLVSGCAAAPPTGGLVSPVDNRRAGDEAGHFELTLRSTDDVLLYAQGWRPHGPPQAAVLIVHGLRDHGARYAPLARELVKRGWAVVAFDLRGHGRSQGRRVTIDRFDRHVDDLSMMVEQLRSMVPDRPLMLLGHSMGGTIASLYAERPGADLDGLVLSAPALRSFVSEAERCAANLLADLAPYAPQLEVEMAAWSRTPGVVDDNRNDPLVYQPGAPIATGAMLLDASAQALHEAPYVRVPTLVMHGGADAIADPAGSRAFVERIRSSDKQLEMYPGLYHDLWNEPERARLIDDLVTWIEARDHDPPQVELECESQCEDPPGDATDP